MTGPWKLFPQVSDEKNVSTLATQKQWNGMQAHIMGVIQKRGLSCLEGACEALGLELQNDQDVCTAIHVTAHMFNQAFNQYWVEWILKSTPYDRLESLRYEEILYVVEASIFPQEKTPPPHIQRAVDFVNREREKYKEKELEMDPAKMDDVLIIAQSRVLKNLGVLFEQTMHETDLETKDLKSGDND